MKAALPAPEGAVPAKLTAQQLMQKIRMLQALAAELLPAAQALQAELHGQDGRKYTAADRQRWRDASAAPDLMLHTDRAKARLIVKREGLPQSAFESVRRAIKKLGNSR